MFRMLLVKKRSSMWEVFIVPLGRVIVCVRVGVSTVCESENVLTMSMNVSCSNRLLVWGILGLGTSMSRGSKGEIAVQSMSGG